MGSDTAKNKPPKEVGFQSTPVAPGWPRCLAHNPLPVESLIKGMGPEWGLGIEYMISPES